MKKQDWLRRCAATFQSSLRLKTNIYGFLAVIMLGLSGCEITHCGEGEGVEPQGACNTVVTVEENACWQSSVGHFWFRTSEGKLLMPVKSLVNLPELQNGMRLKIAYDISEQNPNNYMVCNTLVAVEGPSAAITVTCAEPVGFCGTVPNPPTCNVMATAETVVCGAGVWANIWLRLDDGTLLQPWENLGQNIQPVNGQRYKIGYELMQRDSRYNHAVICQAMPPAAQTARIICLEEVPQTTTTTGE